MNSLEKSLQAGLLGTLLVLLFVFAWAVSLTSRMLAESYVYNELEHIVSDAHEHVELVGNTVGFGQQLFRLPAGTWLVLRHNEVITQWPQNENTVAAVAPQLVAGASRKVSRTSETESAHSLHAWFGGYSKQGVSYVLGAERNTSDLHDKLRVLQIFTALLIAALLLIAGFVQRIILRRAIVKFDDIRRDMLRLERGHAVALSQEVPSEVLPLVVEFNRLLRRFEQRLRQSRNAVGNLAHSLKGPLNVLLRSSEAEPMRQEERELIKHNAEAIRSLIDSELKRARLAGRSAVGVRFDADAELPAMIGLLEQVYIDKQVKISFTIDRDVDLVHDRQDMLELIGNLLDNAAKWCESTVQLNMRSASGVLIEVEDDGPGCTPEVLGRLTERGVRLDESVAGYGLGLSIVNDIVDTYNGRLELTPSDTLGGLRAVVYLPSGQ